MTILVTGGSGYIGSHTILSLHQQGFTDLVVIDNLSNSSPESLKRVEKLSGHSIQFVVGDIRDKQFVSQLFTEHQITTVIHFAGLKSVGESTTQPLEYYDVNVYGTLVLLKCMQEHQVEQLVFSSSATIYGTPEQLPIVEESSTGGVTNPYGRSKLYVEQILQDWCKANPKFKAISLRYFNPVGAHQSGQIGEDPNGIPNNLMPYISQVAVGKLAQLSVYGDDYETVDGTGVRDYIHVVDLAIGHVKAVQAIEQLSTGFNPINLGTGKGYSVLEMIKAFESASGKTINYQITARREGDIGSCYASPNKAKAQLNWVAEKGIEQMCQDAWRWQKQNPNGYN